MRYFIHALSCLTLVQAQRSTQYPARNLWNPLSPEELQSIASWLREQPDPELNTSGPPSVSSNGIFSIALQHPNKSDVLDFLQNGRPAPSRYARAVLGYQDAEGPYLAELLVGPLPISDRTIITPLEYPLTRKTGAKVRDLYGIGSSLEAWKYRIGRSVADVTLFLLGGVVTGSGNDTLQIIQSNPYGQEKDGRLVTWFNFKAKSSTGFDSGTLLPSALSFQADITNRNSEHWEILQWVYDDKSYPTADELREACFAPEFERLGMNFDGNWTSTDQQGAPLPMEHLPPPISSSTIEPRYLYDKDQGSLSWMGFTFFLSFNAETGLGLFDVRYKNTTVLYELSLQESLAHYAGNDPYQANFAALDSTNGVGSSATRLIADYDCPAHATYLNTTMFTYGNLITRPNSICIFEQAADVPLQRHAAPQYTTVTRNSHLKIRWCSTVGNYDFVFTYSFSMDGTVEVEVHASGSIFAAHSAHNEDYGYRIHDHLVGSMHDHIFNFKADFDVLGRANTIQLTKVAPAVKAYSWSGGEQRNSMRLERSMVRSEDNSSLNWDANDQTMLVVLNQDEKNDFGEYRGWRIHKGAGASHLTISDSPVVANAVHWAKHDVHVTAQHDSEPRSAHFLNAFDVYNPPVDFEEFFNGEPLEQNDLVVWFNLGMHHIPTTSDLPNTLTSVGRSSIKFLPHDLFSAGQSRQTINRIRVNYDGDRVSGIETFGQPESEPAACQNGESAAV
ncbi:unnamed protein product [Cercospora beticola]|nr:unnamed protein product [Cercospora beticola]